MLKWLRLPTAQKNRSSVDKMGTEITGLKANRLLITRDGLNYGGLLPTLRGDNESAW